MKKFFSRIIGVVAVGIVAVATPSNTNAQLAQIANQIPDLLSPALSGSMNYKGFVDATSTFGFGNDRANFVGVSTTQGFQYASWFFMGAGIGVDVAMSSTSDIAYGSNRPDAGYAPSQARTKAMIPLFSDFRFNFGGSGTSCFIDIKAGAAWLIGSGYLQLNSGALTNRTQFILRPSLGVRIPVNSQNPKHAINVGVTYQLITANNTWGYTSSYYDTTLNSIGVNVGYEW